MSNAATGYILMPDHMKLKFVVETADYDDITDFDVSERRRCDSFADRYGFSLTEAHDANVNELIYWQRSDELTTEEAEAGMAACTWHHDIPTAAN